MLFSPVCGLRLVQRGILVFPSTLLLPSSNSLLPKETSVSERLGYVGLLKERLRWRRLPLVIWPSTVVGLVLPVGPRVAVVRLLCCARRGTKGSVLTEMLTN